MAACAGEALFRERYRPPWAHVAEHMVLQLLFGLYGWLLWNAGSDKPQWERWLGAVICVSSVVSVLHCALQVARGMMVRVTDRTIIVGATRYARRIALEDVLSCEPAELEWLRRVRRTHAEPWGDPVDKLKKVHSLLTAFWPPWRGVLVHVTDDTCVFVSSGRSEELARAIREQVTALRERAGPVGVERNGGHG